MRDPDALRVTAERERLEAASGWYVEEQLELDRRLVGFRYRTLREFIVGPRGLELGSAEGEMTKRLVDDFEHLTVVEGSRTLLRRLPEAPNLVKVPSLFEEFDTAESFDTVIVDHVLEHVIDPVGLLSRIDRWTRPGSRVLIGVPNAWSIHRLAAVSMGLLSDCRELNARDRAVGHRRVYTPPDLREHVGKAGLDLLRLEGIFLKPLSNQQIQDQWTDEMIEAFYEIGRGFPEHAAELCAVCEVR